MGDSSLRLRANSVFPLPRKFINLPSLEEEVMLTNVKLRTRHMDDFGDRQIKRRTTVKVKYVLAKTSVGRTKLSQLSGTLVPFCGVFLLRISSR